MPSILSLQTRRKTRAMPEPDPSNTFAGGGEFPPNKVDPDWLYFLQHVRPDGHSYVLEVPARGASPPVSIRYEEPPVASSGGDAQSASGPSPAQALARSDRRMEDEDSSADPPWLDSHVDIDKDYRLFLQHTRVVNDRMVLEIGGVVVNYEPDAARSGGSSGVEQETMGEKVATIASSGIRVGVGEEEEMGVDSDEPVVIFPKPKTWDWRADPTPGQKVEGEEDGGLLNASSLRTPETRNREKSLSNGYDAEPHVASGSQGVIWPTHINQRPDSDFKRRLMEVLLKPISRREYIKLFDMASIRTPLVKLRQVRNDVKFYPTDEMGNSYFDHYPDLVEQVTNTSFSNGLALMRGFFFWLQNTAHEDQFRPWIHDSKDHELIPLMD